MRSWHRWILVLVYVMNLPVSIQQQAPGWFAGMFNDAESDETDEGGEMAVDVNTQGEAHDLNSDDLEGIEGVVQDMKAQFEDQIRHHVTAQVAAHKKGLSKMAQSRIVSYMDLEVRARVPSCPERARRRALALPRVKCCSSWVTR